ncbi:MAG: TonB family protein [Acidobacteriota bacterium]
MSDKPQWCASCSREIAGDNGLCASCTPTQRTEELSTYKNPQAGVVGGAGSSSNASRFTPGEVLAGRYRIEGQLGSGGMGEVYRAYDFVLDLNTALKFLPENLEKDTVALNRLKDEVKIAREIAHPNVCRVYDIGEANGVFFLSMEYIAGDTLSDYLRRLGRIPREKAISISHQICESLDAVHSKDILHRDLKPSNVLLDELGNVVLTDFGLAASVGEQSVGGTPAYMAPELWEGSESSKASDIYALGLLIYEIFTGRRPFRGKTPAEFAHSHLKEIPPAPSRFLPSIDDDVENMISECLAKAPQDRPASALFLAQQFDALSGSPALENDETSRPTGRNVESEETERSSINESGAGGISSKSIYAARLRSLSRKPSSLAAILLILLGLTTWLVSSRTETEYGVLKELAGLGVLAVPSENGYRVFIDESIEAAQLPAVWSLLGKLRYVEELEISDVKGFTALEPVRSLEGLERLSLSQMENVSRLDALQGLTSIRELSLAGLPGVYEMEPVGSLENLRKLRLANLEKVDDLTALRKLEALEQLILSEMREISSEKVEALRLLIPELEIRELEPAAAVVRDQQDAPSGFQVEPPLVSPIEGYAPEQLEIRAQERVTNSKQPQIFVPPIVSSKVKLPSYPEPAKVAGVTGDVALLVTIDSDGLVKKIVELESLTFGLSESTVEAVSGWRFAPARLDGKPVAVDFELKVGFVGKDSGGFVVLYRSGRVVRIFAGG